jgi:hypothetical protein
MNPKKILTLIGLVLGMQSIAIFLGAEAIATEAFASLSPDATGIEIGATMHRVLAALNMMVAIIVLSARNLEQSAAAKVLMGVSIGLLLPLGHGLYNLLATETKPPLPVLGVLAVLMVLGFVAARKG